MLLCTDIQELDLASPAAIKAKLRGINNPEEIETMTGGEPKL